MLRRFAGTSKPGCLLYSMVTCVALLPSMILADSAVWRIDSGDESVYIGGTVHLLRPEDYPLPEEYETAYNAADELYFETDLDALNDMAVQASMLRQLTYTDGRTLQTVLNEEAYTTLSEYVSSIGLSMMLIDRMKPGMVVSTLQVFEFQRMGFTPEGVDAHFNSRAISDGKLRGQLESVQDQIGFIASMGEGNESEFILLSLSDLEETDALMDDIIQAWREGNNQMLTDLFVTDMLEQAPQVYNVLLKDRNVKWVELIRDMFKDDNQELVLVGAAHLVGPDGLLTLLRNEGYTVTQI